MDETALVLLPNAIAICLVAGLAISVIARQPPRRLQPALLSYQICALLYLVGDAITLVSRDMLVEQIGIAILYTGAIPAAAACWILTLRYAEAEGLPFRWATGWWIRAPIAICAVSWGVMITNPWHGQFVIPVIGADNVHLWGWWLLVPWGYGLVNGSLLLYGALARRAREQSVRRNARLMASAIFATLVFNFLSYLPQIPLPFDLTVVGLGCASAIFLYGAYRTRLFSLLPAAVLESARQDPSGLVLVDLDGTWLRSNPAASKMLSTRIERPGHDVIGTVARRLRGPDAEPLRRRELARRLLEGPRAARQTVGPLHAGDGYWVEITATPIPPSEGHARAVSLRFEDVSARVAAEEQLRRARRELATETAERRQVDRLLGEILRDTGLAEAELARPDRAKRLLARIRDTAEQARQMTGVVVSTPLRRKDGDSGR